MHRRKHDHPRRRRNRDGTKAGPPRPANRRSNCSRRRPTRCVSVARTLLVRRRAPMTFATEPAPPKIDSQTAGPTPSGFILESADEPEQPGTAPPSNTAPAKQCSSKAQGTQAPGTTTLPGRIRRPARERPAAAPSLPRRPTSTGRRGERRRPRRSTPPSTSFTTPPAPALHRSVRRRTHHAHHGELPGTVNPGGLETSYHYDTGRHLLRRQRPALQGVNAGREPKAFPPRSDQRPDPATTYHYRLVATNADGTTPSDDKTFTTAPATPPTARTGEASNITLTTATIAGRSTLKASNVLRARPRRRQTYGTSFYGEAGSADTPTEITLSLQNLAPGHLPLPDRRDQQRRPHQRHRPHFTTPAFSNPIVQPPGLPLLATPAIAFPTETANTAKPKAKTPTRAQLLVAALKACHRLPRGHRRHACKAQAHRRYAPVKRAHKSAVRKRR